MIHDASDLNGLFTLSSNGGMGLEGGGVAVKWRWDQPVVEERQIPLFHCLQVVPRTVVPH